MYYKLNCLLNLIIFFINIKCLQTFHVNFQYNYNLKVEPFNTQIYKRELNQFFDKASFSLKGFEKIASIPLTFPIDICLFKLENIKYATALHIRKNGARHFVVLRIVNGSYDFIADIATPNAIAMDCINFNNKGYVAIALNLTQPINYAQEGSPIYEIVGNRLRAVQYFSASNLMSLYLRVSGNDFFLLHIYSNIQGTSHLFCPYFKWSGTSFNNMGQIPCSNARQLAPFSIDYESYVAVANYADQNGRTNTYSEIYKFSREKKKFVLFQKIKTNGAVDVKYFNVPYNEVKKQHFLIFGNSINTVKDDANNLEADSVLYIFDKGQFIPYQKLSFYAINKILPVQNTEAEKFLLLVACKDQDIKIYNLNDWKFEESKVQFTEGALGKGVSNMRIYQENENSYLIIANQLMIDNETNIFLPIFKQEENANILRQQIIDWAKQETQRLKTTNINKLIKRVEDKIQRLEKNNYLPNVKHIPYADIQTVSTETLIYPNLKMSANYWTALGYISQALDLLESQLKQKQRLKRNINDGIPYNNMEYVYETLNVNNLTINESLKAKTVNKVFTENPEFLKIKAPKVIVTEKYNKSFKKRVNILPDFMDENRILAVRNLQITGKLNEYHWKDLFNSTLKRKEDIQFLKAKIHIERLKTDTIVVNNDKVNEQNLGALIPIEGGKYVINQHIQFTAPIHANKVSILKRLNNLYVVNGQFNVLLKKANKTQVIQGLKDVTNIKVLEPMTLAGKVIGRQLAEISSHKIINDSLVLQGNVIINGNVSINHQLKALDIIDLKEKLALKHVLENGIRMDKSLKDFNIKFLQPLKANNSLISFINGHDLQRLIRLNQNDIQIIEGKKIFNESLEIKKGFSEVKNLNGVDIDELEQKAFLKNTNQNIKVPIKSDKITAKSIESLKILLNNKTLADYMTLTGNQSIKGSLIVDDLKALNLKVKHLNTYNKIFHQDLKDIYQQNFRDTLQEGVLQENHKFHGSIYVNNLILNTTINNKAVQDIENQLLLLESNIKFVGDINFHNGMNVTNITFQGKLNDISAKDFGNCWLQKKAEKQEFTEFQSFSTIHAENGIQLLNKFNGFTMEEFYTQTYWINRDEYLENVHFENPIEIMDSLTTQRLNEYVVTQDILFKDEKSTPIILNSLSINKDLIVEGIVKNITTINDINLDQLDELLNDHKENTLFVENAYFAQAIPVYKTLNNHNIKETLDTVWLANEDVVLPPHVEIANAYFEGLLEFEGPINDMNLNYLRENYFSKTKLQQVPIEMVFSEGATYNKELESHELHVFGNLLDQESGIRFNFNEFVQNTLKISGLHIISGNWSIRKAIVQGNVNNVLINHLNLINDIVLNVKPIQPFQINSHKIFRNAEIDNIYANYLSVINNVPVAQWIRDTVYLYENYTIKGTTTIDYLNVYNNLMALGSVNNITFNKQNLLLKDGHQHIPGSLKIISYLTQTKRFLPNSIEYLYVDYINQKHVPTFINNLVINNANAELKSHLIFTHPVKIEKYEDSEGFLTQNKWTKRNIDKQKLLSSENTLLTTDVTLDKVHGIKDFINKEYAYKIADFDIKQTIKVKSPEIFVMSLKFDCSKEDILFILDMERNNCQAYKWIAQKQQYEETNDFEWLPQDPISLKIIQKRFELSKQFTDVLTLKSFINHDLEKIYRTLQYPTAWGQYFEFLNETCIIYQHISATTIKQLTTYCLNDENNKTVLNVPKDIVQVTILKEHILALLSNNSIYIYNTIKYSPQLKEKIIRASQAKQMAFGYFNNICYLAVLSYKNNTINQDFVEIYRSINLNDFVLFQQLECSQPCLQIKFSNIEKSNDLLLHIITNSSIAPYLLYQYQGVMGFQLILSHSILPKNIQDSRIVNLHTTDQHLVALIYEKYVTFTEIVTF